MKNLQDAGIDNVFFVINPAENMYTIFSAVLHRQSKSDVMMYCGIYARSAIYYEAGSPLGGMTFMVNAQFPRQC
jgi:hypothetical protein